MIIALITRYLITKNFLVIFEPVFYFCNLFG